MMQYKGYVGEVEVDDEAHVIFGTLVGIRHIVTFEGETVEEARKAFHDSVDDYLALCAERGTEPEKPFSGKFMVRVSPELHRDAVYMARRHDMSLNKFVERALNVATATTATVPRVAPAAEPERSYATGPKAKAKAGGKKAVSVDAERVTASGQIPARASKAKAGKVKRPSG